MQAPLLEGGEVTTTSRKLAVNAPPKGVGFKKGEFHLRK